MSILFKFGKELFWTIFWVLVALIVAGYALNFISGLNIPVVSPFSSWVEQHAQV